MRKALYLVVFVLILCGCQKDGSISGNEMKDVDSVSRYDYQEIVRASEVVYDNCDMNLDNWIGTYSFFEHAKDDEIPMNMEYKIEICQEEDVFYAYYYQCGHNFYLNNKAIVYGNNEWISIVLGESLDDNSYFNGISSEVILSLRMDGDKIYTYWGEYTEPLLNENRQSEIVCITRDDDKSSGWHILRLQNPS